MSCNLAFKSKTHANVPLHWSVINALSGDF